ncbi:phage tail family protein [Bacillus thermotolerans]|uniref:Phage protein n=1 Tax=Bacillus thermotolerans TaxID=1221996 RepID=A0A0F5I0H7_BACTR|nr:phage tail family protein [Bacillus thermotolerans]KKB34649.1 Phage protein [Bacillus thermotolerans]KKB38577.1 Phage protein [Bacillus thermotolerans]
MSGHDYLTFEEGIDIILERLDGARYSFKEHGIGVRDFVVRSPHYVTTYEEVANMLGMLDTGTKLGYRQLKMSLYFVADSMDLYAKKRDEVFRILNSQEAFYITESRRPMQRWLVKVTGSFEPDQARLFGFVDVELVSASPFAESPGTTLRQPYTDFYYPIGEGRINEGDPPVQYVFTENTFSVFNDSDITVDPRNMDVLIEFVGESNDLTIRNLTTGDAWSYNGSSSVGDVIRLEGIRSLKNGQSIFGQTNKKLIRLDSGWNDFEISGASDFVISFDFRFYYL